MENMNTIAQDKVTDRRSNGFPFTFRLNKPLLTQLKNFSKDDIEINKYLSSVSKKIHFDPEDSSNFKEWNEEQIAVYFYFHIMCINFFKLFEKLEIANSLEEKSKIIQEEIENLIKTGYHFFCEKSNGSEVNLSISDLNLKGVRNFLTAKSQTFTNELKNDGTFNQSMKIIMSDDFSQKIFSSNKEKNLLNLSWKIVIKLD